MRILLFLYCILGVFPLLLAQEIPKVQIETFDAVFVRAAIKLEIEPAMQASMSVTSASGNANLLQDIKIVVKGGKATIDYTGRGTLTGEIRVILHTPTLVNVKAIQSAEVTIGNFTGRNLLIEATNEARIKMLACNYRSISLNLDHNARAELAGSARSVQVDARKSSKYIGTLLLTRNLRIKAGGTADLEVYSAQSISAKIEDQASVRAFGGAKNLSLTGSAAGNFRKVE